MKYTARFINGAAFKPTDWGDDGKPIIRIAQLTGKDFDNYFKGAVNPRYYIEDNDLLFSWSATLDSFIWDRGPAILNQHIFKVEPFQGTHKKFLYYSLKHYSQIWADVDAHGSTMRHIKKDSLGNKIWFPDFDEQIAIAHYLDCETAQIDHLIKKRRRFEKVLREARLSLLANAINGAILGGKSYTEAGWLKKIPSHWRMERAKVHFIERQGRSTTGDEELLTVSHLTGVTKRSDKNVNMFMAESNEGYKLVEPSDVVINTMWAWMGAMGISRDRGLISPAYGIYEPIKNDLLPEFVDLMMRSRPFIAEATRRSKGIHSSRLRLYPDAFLDTPLPIPPLSEQEEIIRIVTERTQKEDQLLELNSKAITLLEEKRAALITAAVTGELNISEGSVVSTPANDDIPLLVASEIIRANHQIPRFGRVKFQKLIYLAETHIGFTEIEGSYDREAAGPLDRVLLNRLEAGLEAQNLFRATNPDGRAIIYEALGASPAGRDELRQAIGSRSDALFTMIQKLSDMKTKSVEAIATLFAVWNDALIDGQSPDDDFIINGVLNDWHPEKRKKFRDEDLRNWLGWMRRNGFVPKGKGPRTSTGRLFV